MHALRLQASLRERLDHLTASACASLRRLATPTMARRRTPTMVGAVTTLALGCALISTAQGLAFCPRDHQDVM